MTLLKSACITLVTVLGFTATEAPAMSFAEWLKNLQKQAQNQSQQNQKTPAPNIEKKEKQAPKRDSLL